MPFLYAGLGYGGSCFPKDVQALIMSSDEVKYDFEILKAVEKVNANQKLHLVEKIKAYYNGNLAGKHFALWGLAFKPNTDDVRESPAIKIVEELSKKGLKFLVSDPVALKNFDSIVEFELNEEQRVVDWRACVKEADVIIILCAWPEYADIKYHDLRGKTIFDARRMLNPYELEDCRYLSIGCGDNN